MLALASAVTVLLAVAWAVPPFIASAVDDAIELTPNALELTSPILADGSCAVLPFPVILTTVSPTLAPWVNVIMLSLSLNEWRLLSSIELPRVTEVLAKPAELPKVIIFEPILNPASPVVCETALVCDVSIMMPLLLILVDVDVPEAVVFTLEESLPGVRLQLALPKEFALSPEADDVDFVFAEAELPVIMPSTDTAELDLLISACAKQLLIVSSITRIINMAFK